jgi:uncharacterized protein YjgD (DUF1641 family)
MEDEEREGQLALKEVIVMTDKSATATLMEPETLENILQVINRLAELNQTIEDLIDLAKYMVPAFAELGEDMANMVSDAGQKVYTPENMELAKRIGAAAPAYLRLLDTMLKLGENGTIDRVTGILEQVSRSDIMAFLEGAVEAASEVDVNNPRKFSVFEAARDLNDKEVQKTLGIVLDVARKLPSAVERHRAEA